MIQTEVMQFMKFGGEKEIDIKQTGRSVTKAVSDTYQDESERAVQGSSPNEDLWDEAIIRSQL